MCPNGLGIAEGGKIRVRQLGSYFLALLKYSVKPLFVSPAFGNTMLAVRCNLTLHFRQSEIFQTYCCPGQRNSLVNIYLE